jgi:uncharacterized protein
MFSLQAMFGKGDHFFGLLEQSSMAARDSAQALLTMLKQQSADLKDFKAARTREKQLAQQIGEDLVNTFVTALEREDIEAMSSLLYKVPKTLEKFAERYPLVRHVIPDVDFTPRAIMVSQAMDICVEFVHMLRKGMDLQRAKQLNDRLKAIESEADRLLLETYQEIGRGDHDAIRLMLKKDLFDLLEKTIDRCRDLGNTIYTIVLKNS